MVVKNAQKQQKEKLRVSIDNRLNDRVNDFEYALCFSNNVAPSPADEIYLSWNLHVTESFSSPNVATRLTKLTPDFALVSQIICCSISLFCLHKRVVISTFCILF